LSNARFGSKTDSAALAGRNAWKADNAFCAELSPYHWQSFTKCSLALHHELGWSVIQG